jgi:hypothetical protein
MAPDRYSKHEFGGLPFNFSAVIAFQQRGTRCAVVAPMNALDELTYVAGTLLTLLVALSPFWVPALLAMS